MQTPKMNRSCKAFGVSKYLIVTSVSFYAPIIRNSEALEFTIYIKLHWRQIMEPWKLSHFTITLRVSVHKARGWMRAARSYTHAPPPYEATVCLQYILGVPCVIQIYINLYIFNTTIISVELSVWWARWSDGKSCACVLEVLCNVRVTEWRDAEAGERHCCAAPRWIPRLTPVKSSPSAGFVIAHEIRARSILCHSISRRALQICVMGFGRCETIRIHFYVFNTQNILDRPTWFISPNWFEG